MNRIKTILIVILFPLCLLQAQEADKKAQQEAKRALRESKNITYQANENLVQNDFINAEAEYRRAISKSSENAAAPYNLGRAHYNRESYTEAFGNFKQAGEKATSKPDKHKAFHNMGNVFMQSKEYQKAVEAYKEALRANPKDEETRYNLALAKELLKKQQNDQKKDDKDDDQKKDDQKEDQEKNKDQDNEGENDKDKEGDQKDDQNKDEGKDGDKGKDKPEENKEGEGDEKKEKQQKPSEGDQKEQQKKPRPNQLSKQQVQNLLEAMQNEEKKVQQKIDAKKIKGAKVKNEKDW